MWLQHVFALALLVISDKPGASVAIFDAAIAVSVPIALPSLDVSVRNLSLHRCEKHSQQEQQQQQAYTLHVHEQECKHTHTHTHTLHVHSLHSVRIARHVRMILQGSQNVNGMLPLRLLCSKSQERPT